MPVAKQETPLPWQAARGWILNMHCFPVQCRIHIHGEHVFVLVFYGYGGVERRYRPGPKQDRERGGEWRCEGRERGWLCPENGQTMGPYWIIPTSLARPAGANLY
ncbi:hypothetical protein QLX08_001675 [Tetragonisca angustula]|uniref:Uncharacterized protein n=1 Tax=Tetragonisca angustula TaxID=166442 RepID=A0AAW1AEC2_9HYME